MTNVITSDQILVSIDEMETQQSFIISSTGKEFDVKAKCVINATGPFTDSLRKMDNQESQKICQPSAGVHIVIPGYYRYTSSLINKNQFPPSALPHLFLLRLRLTFLCF